MSYDSDLQLLTELLSRMQGERNPEETARMLMTHFGSLHSIAECLPKHDSSLPLSQNVRMLLSMIPGLCRHLELERMGDRPLLDTLQSAARYAESLYIGVHYERIYLLCLDKNFRLIRHCQLGEGSVREVPFYPRRILQEALSCSAQAVILCHNHLSGWCFFSEADLASTKEFLRLCTSIQLPLLDHLLVADNQVSSLRSKAHIPDADWRASGPLMPSLNQWRAAQSAGRIEFLPGAQ